MVDLLGFISISVVSIITLVIVLRWPGISNILIAALIIRIIILLIGHYIVPLPGGDSDAIGYENRAWDLSQKGFFIVLSSLDFGPFAFFSWLHAIPYSLFGRSIMMGQSISLLCGIGTIFYAWKFANVIWGEHIAKKVGWTIALFPSVVLYSVLFLREAYVTFFLVLALYGVVSWIKNNNYKSILLSLMGFIAASLFHGPMIVGAIIFIMFVFITYLNKLFKSLVNFRINIENLVIFLFCVIVIGLYFSNKISFSYLGTFENSIDINFLIERQNSYLGGDASWPEWTIARSVTELIYKAPIRMIYFVFSPFPWDVEKLGHLIGFFDSILYLYLVILILRNLKVIWREPSLKIILIILLFYILVFAFGVGNFGTAFRHKSKFAFMFIILAAPLINTLIFNKKVNSKNSK